MKMTAKERRLLKRQSQRHSNVIAEKQSSNGQHRDRADALLPVDGWVIPEPIVCTADCSTCECSNLSFRGLFLPTKNCLTVDRDSKGRVIMLDDHNNPIIL